MERKKYSKKVLNKEDFLELLDSSNEESDENNDDESDEESSEESNEESSSDV